MPPPILLIHGYSAESDTADTARVTAIYGNLPDRLRAAYGDANVFELDVSRYISLDDGVTLDDIAFALDRALQTDFSELLEGKFRVIIHSTGALVIRNWIRRFSLQYKDHPLELVIYLAGALSGSGWAHIGGGSLAKWGRWVFDAGSERGVRVLEGLELASEWTLELHTHFFRPDHAMFDRYGVREAAIIGSSPDAGWFDTPIRYATERGSDGVVRVAAGNPNIGHIKIAATEKARTTSWDLVRVLDEEDKTVGSFGHKGGGRYEAREIAIPGESTPVVPFAVAFDRAHSRKTGIVQEVTDQVDRLIRIALDGTNQDWNSVLKEFQSATEETYRLVKASTKKRGGDSPSQYDAHAQVIFRLRDQDGRPVKDFDAYFQNKIFRDENPQLERIGDLCDDKHVNRLSPNCVCFYFRLTQWDSNLKEWRDRLASAGRCFLEISATQPYTDKIRYLPLQIELYADDMARWLRRHSTTIIDVEIFRVPAPEVFVIRTAP